MGSPVKTTVMCIVTACLLASGSASARFISESYENPFGQGSQVRIVGSDKFQVIHGFARATTLSEAIGQIIPNGYAVRAQGLERVGNAGVAWVGGKPWPEVLREVLRSVPGVVADIDANNKIVSLSIRSAGFGHGAGGGAPYGAPGYGMPHGMLTHGVWELRDDDRTVKGAFERWASAAGWQLVWDIGYDYPIGAAAAFSVSFEEAVEMVTKALQGSQFPPKAIFYRGNRVLRIVDRGVE